MEINEHVAKRLRDEQVIWLTTIREDGQPLPTPVWFLWVGNTFLIYSQPDALKVKNIANNSKVALNLNSDAWGGEVVVITGEAAIDASIPSAINVPAYIEKYREGIKQINMTPESLSQAFNTPIRVTPTRVRTNE